MCKLIVRLAALCVTMGISASAFAQTKPVVTFAFTNEITYEPYIYAIKAGKVTSNAVEVRLLPTAIPALLQATGTKQFDLLETSPLLLANALSRGLDARIAGTAGIVRGGRYVIVKKDSPIKSAADLKGKSLGATALASTLVAHLRAVFRRQNGFDVGLENGDIKWVELPLATLPGAVLRNQIDSAFVIHIPSLKAINSGEFRVIVDVTKSYHQLFGVDPLTSVLATYDSKIKEKGDALRAAVELLRSSAAYFASHADEVLTAVAKEHGMDEKELRTVSRDWYDVRFTLNADDKKMIESIWQVGTDIGSIKAAPKVDSVLWQ
jgi:NitT/TauT family transport system substrate-binding protein